MGRVGASSSTALSRLGASIKRRLADYLDLAPYAEARASRALETSVEALKDRLGAALAERRRLQSELSALANAPVDEAARAEAAIGLGRDDLARAALRQRALLAARAKEVERMFDVLGEEAARLEALLGAIGPGDRLLAEKLAELDRLLSANVGADEEH